MCRRANEGSEQNMEPMSDHLRGNLTGKFQTPSSHETWDWDPIGDQPAWQFIKQGLEPLHWSDAKPGGLQSTVCACVCVWREGGVHCK